MPELLRKLGTAAIALLIAAIPCGCDHLDDDRIPVEAVNIVFATQADWTIYGVTGAMTWKRFIRSERIPRDFPYTAMTYTGFGGILLLCDVSGTPQAYDLACPMERKQNIRVTVNEDAEFLAECPECHSRYNVFSLSGHPVSGPAVDRGYALRRYHVSARDGNYMVISY